MGLLGPRGCAVRTSGGAAWRLPPMQQRQGLLGVPVPQRLALLGCCLVQQSKILLCSRTNYAVQPHSARGSGSTINREQSISRRFIMVQLCTCVLYFIRRLSRTRRLCCAHCRYSYQKRMLVLNVKSVQATQPRLNTPPQRSNITEANVCAPRQIRTWYRLPSLHFILLLNGFKCDIAKTVIMAIHNNNPYRYNWFQGDATQRPQECIVKHLRVGVSATQTYDMELEIYDQDPPYVVVYQWIQMYKNPEFSCPFLPFLGPNNLPLIAIMGTQFCLSRHLRRRLLQRLSSVENSNILVQAILHR